MNTSTRVSWCQCHISWHWLPDCVTSGSDGQIKAAPLPPLTASQPSSSCTNPQSMFREESLFRVHDARCHRCHAQSEWRAKLCSQNDQQQRWQAPGQTPEDRNQMKDQEPHTHCGWLSTSSPKPGSNLGHVDGDRVKIPESGDQDLLWLCHWWMCDLGQIISSCRTSLAQ